MILLEELGVGLMLMRRFHDNGYNNFTTGKAVSNLGGTDDP
jgi:hypothetical protein